MNIDGIIAVNLDKRTERWDLFQKHNDCWKRAFGKVPERFSASVGVELEGYGQAPWFRERIKEARRKSWGGKAGAILSHRNAIQYAKDAGWNNVLILEDDAFLTEKMAARWTSSIQGVIDELGDDWAAIYLYSAKPFSPFRSVLEKDDNHIIEVAGAFGCVAYIVNASAYDALLSKLPDEKNVWPWVARYKAIDLWLSLYLRRIGRVFAVAPSLVEHQVGPSDITVTPEAEWTFDGEMKGLRLTNSSLLFAIKMRGRSVSCFYESCIAGLRFCVKRIRGL